MYLEECISAKFFCCVDNLQKIGIDSLNVWYSL